MNEETKTTRIALKFNNNISDNWNHDFIGIFSETICSILVKTSFHLAIVNTQNGKKKRVHGSNKKNIENTLFINCWSMLCGAAMSLLNFDSLLSDVLIN